MNARYLSRGFVPDRNHPALTASGLKLVARLLASTALMATPALAGDALPTGASVASGDVSVSSSGAAMTVTQGSDKAIVNWQGFSVGKDNSVTFVQPDTSSAILNRVTSSATSEIAGTVTGNGQVYLINPNGIAISSTGTVKVGGGFVASTLDIRDEDFLSGNLAFKGNGASAGVSNDGVVTIGRGGYAALMGGTVKNDGLIAVPLGKAGLGAGEQATLDLSGDGFLQVAVPSKNGIEGDGALIENSGTISAEGGVVVMKAATAKAAARQAINMSGVVEANSISGRNGAITLGGGAGGTVKVAGRVSAVAPLPADVPVPTPRPGTTGGKIAVTGDAIELAGATIDASGAAGGGSVNIGGLKHGAAGLQTASTTSVDAATVIRADATQEGNGGGVVVWSDDLTSFDGNIIARGAGTGTGGDAEVSGKSMLAYAGFADLSAPGGFGTLLLDPYNLTISSAANSGVSGTVANSNDSILNVDTLTAALAGANVLVSTGSGGSQAGDITVDADIAWSADTTLSLDAANAIAINADITATGNNAGLAMTYGDDYSISSGSSITLSGTNAMLALGGTSYTLIHSMSELDAIDTTGLSGSYALAEDLNASGEGTYTEALVGSWFGANAFTGTFAGLGHTISDLVIDTGLPDAATGKSYDVGLFGYVEGGTIRDIGLVGGSVTGSYDVGGLVGTNDGGTISNAYTTGSVSGSSYYVGGLVGYNTGTIANAYATGNVAGAQYFVGGLVGRNYGTIANVYATGNVAGARYDTGGLVGNNYGTITNAYATGDVAGSGGSVGGLVGANYGAAITNAYATGSVSTSGKGAGGLVGINHGTITNAYATGGISALGFAGGLVGDNLGTIANAYAVGRVSGTGNTVGGLVGTSTGKLSHTFWDMDTTGQSNGAGNVRYSTDFTGLSTADFQNTALFMSLASAWGFENVWAPPSSGYYPELYALSPVVWVDQVTRTSVYGDTSGTQTVGSFHGGSNSYIFGAAGDTLDLDGAVSVDGTRAVGTYTNDFAPPNGSVVSAEGTTYRAVYYGTNDEATATVTARPITVTADDQWRLFGYPNPMLTYSVTSGSLVNNDSLSGELTTEADSTSAVGSYPITQGTLDASSNYDLTFVDGELYVLKPATDTGATASSVAGLITSSPQKQQGQYGSAASTDDQDVVDLLDQAACFTSNGFAISCGN